MVNPGLSFEQTMMDLSHTCYTPSFIIIGSLVQKKMILKGCFTIYAHVSLLGHMTYVRLIDFHTKFDQNGLVVSEKSKF